jgi:glucose-1-phosphate adenylyltransferase
MVFEGVDVGRHAVIRRAIVDKGVCIPPGTVIGVDAEADAARGLTVSPGGVTVVPKGFCFPTPPRPAAAGLASVVAP